MRTVGAIAAIAFRSCVRSRLFIVLAVVLLGIVTVLPMTLKGDGTPEGLCRVRLVYTLGFAAAVLGVASLWLGCGAVDGDIEGRQIRLVRTKPVHAVQIWLGKWAGVLLLDAILLAGVGLGVAVQVQRVLYADDVGPAERARLRRNLLVGRRAWRPEPAADGPAVSAGGTLHWRFRPDGALRSRMNAGREPDLVLRFRIHAAWRGRTPATGVWTAGPEEAPAPFTHAVGEQIEGTFRLPLPAHLLPRDGSVLAVSFRHTGVPDTSAPVIFDPHDPVAILVRETGFAANFARALGLIYGTLALLAALGVTFGILFSFPTATFAALALLAVTLMAHVLSPLNDPYGTAHHHHHGHEAETTPSAASLVLTHAGLVLQHGLRHIASPALRFTPLRNLSDGLLISGGETAAAIGILVALYPAVLAAAGALVLARKELAR
jgi:hypothetical protein